MNANDYRKKDDDTLIYPLQPFKLLAADLSLRRPAFAILEVDPVTQRIQVDKLVDIDNRVYELPHGFLFQRIAEAIAALAWEADIFTREGVRISPSSEKTILEVAGVAELALWQARKVKFYDIMPGRVKKLITGSEFARKEEVANALARYVGPREYTCDGHSDAIAVGISWLKLAGILEERNGQYRISRTPNCNDRSVHGSAMLLYRNMMGVGGNANC